MISAIGTTGKKPFCNLQAIAARCRRGRASAAALGSARGAKFCTMLHPIAFFNPILILLCPFCNPSLTSDYFQAILCTLDNTNWDAHMHHLFNKNTAIIYRECSAIQRVCGHYSTSRTAQPRRPKCLHSKNRQYELSSPT